jgi:4-hydroxy-L-threonine phosphate dehydrogenase PdxA
MLGSAIRSPSKMGGEASMRFCLDAIEAAQKKIVDAVVTAPIAKESWKLAGIIIPATPNYSHTRPAAGDLR